MDNPKIYIKIPRNVEALPIVDYMSMKSAKEWVNNSGGFAEITNMKERGKEKLVVETTLGLIEVPRMYYLIKGDLGGFYSYPFEIFEKEYQLIENS